MPAAIEDPDEPADAQDARPPPPRVPARADLQPSLVLITAVAGITCCPLLAAFAWTAGSEHVRRRRAAGDPVDPLADWGRLIGMLVTSLWALLLAIPLFALLLQVIVAVFGPS